MPSKSAQEVVHTINSEFETAIYGEAKHGQPELPFTGERRDYSISDTTQLICLTYMSTGNVEAILWNDFPIWDSENSPGSKEVDGKEVELDLEQYIRDELTRLIHNLNLVYKATGLLTSS